MNYRNFFLFSFILILIDQLTKNLIKDKSIDLGLFSLTYTKNTGTILGFFKDNNLIFIFLTIFVIIFILYYIKKYDELFLPLLFLISGAFGNLIDRILHGFVVDFINFGFFPIFNFADIYNTIAFFLLILILINFKKFKKYS